MSVTIYYNPRCSKSRQALQLLQARGIEPKVVNYLETPPERSELLQILEMLAMEPRDLMRKQQAEYKANGLDRSEISRDRLIDAMLKHPILIERPIVVSGKRAALGRPPERILEIL